MYYIYIYIIYIYIYIYIYINSLDKKLTKIHLKGNSPN